MRGCVVVVLAALLATPAAATSGISPRYDGTYAGRAMPEPGTKNRCPSFGVDALRISKGVAHSGPSGAQRASVSDAPVISGFITEEGFFTGSIMLPDSARNRIEGRLKDGVLVAGVIDNASGCAWVLNLRPVS
jgi:hypothetical protein